MDLAYGDMTCFHFTARCEHDMRFTEDFDGIKEVDLVFDYRGTAFVVVPFEVRHDLPFEQL